MSDTTNSSAKNHQDPVDALPGSGRLDVSDDDIDGTSGPIQVP